MKIQVTKIEFDFECDDGQVTRKVQDALTNYTLGKVYEVDHEDEIADAISDDTGWCIKSIDYKEV